MTRLLRSPLAVVLTLSSVFALTVVWGGLVRAGGFSPNLADFLSFRTHAGDQTSRSEVFLPLRVRAVLHATAVATDKEALIELFENVNKKDTPAQEKLVGSGRVFVVDYGTTVRVLGYYRGIQPLRILGRAYTGELLRVRILDGECAGVAVWVPSEWVEESKL